MRKLIRKVINILIIASYSDQSINPKGYEEPHLKVKKPNLLTRVKRGLLKPSEEKIMATKSKTGTISNLCRSMYRRRGLKKTVRCYLWTTGTPSKKWRRAVILLSRFKYRLSNKLRTQEFQVPHNRIIEMMILIKMIDPYNK